MYLTGKRLVRAYKYGYFRTRSKMTQTITIMVKSIRHRYENTNYSELEHKYLLKKTAQLWPVFRTREVST